MMREKKSVNVFVMNWQNAMQVRVRCTLVGERIAHDEIWHAIIGNLHSVSLYMASVVSASHVRFVCIFIHSIQEET